MLADEFDRLIDERDQAAENADLGIRLLKTGEGVIRALAHTLCEQQAKADRLQAEVDAWKAKADRLKAERDRAESSEAATHGALCKLQTERGAQALVNQEVTRRMQVNNALRARVQKLERRAEKRKRFTTRVVAELKAARAEVERLKAENDRLRTEVWRQLAGPATPQGDVEPAQQDGRGVGYAPTTTSERSLTVTFKREEHGQRPLIVEPSADQVQRYGGDGTPEPEPERTWTGVLAGCIHVEMGEAVLLPSEARCSWTCHHGQRCIKKAGHDELHDYLGCACANPDAWCGRCDTPLGRRPTQGEVDVTCSGCGAVVALTPPHDPMGEG